LDEKDQPRRQEDHEKSNYAFMPFFVVSVVFVVNQLILE